MVERIAQTYVPKDIEQLTAEFEKVIYVNKTSQMNENLIDCISDDDDATECLYVCTCLYDDAIYIFILHINLAVLYR
jgi:hypothetical protein